MGLFDIFNANKRKWISLQTDSNMSPKFRQIIKDFFIHDDIVIEKYMENQRANATTEGWNGGLQNWEDLNNISMEKEPPINCTKTFRQHYSNDRLNRGAKMPEWLYIAYPDVAHWFHANLKKFNPELERRQHELFGKDEVPTYFFREIIERFKAANGKLECTAD